MNTSEVKQVVKSCQTEQASPICCVNPSSGIFEVLMSGSVPLTLTHTVLVSSLKHTDTQPLVNKGVGTKAWSEKGQKQPAPHSHHPSSNSTTAEHLMRRIKWFDQLPALLSGSERLADCGNSEVQPQQTDWLTLAMATTDGLLMNKTLHFNFKQLNTC